MSVNTTSAGRIVGVDGSSPGNEASGGRPDWPHPRGDDPGLGAWERLRVNDLMVPTVGLGAWVSNTPLSFGVWSG